MILWRGKDAGMFEIDGERLRAAREAAFLSQRELSEAAGLTQSTVSRLEMGKQQAQGATVRKLAQALGVEAASLVVQDVRTGERKPAGAS
jgi:transcriptional regulator with XRE-family HTH domain